jgi:DNA-binding NarL/FixJ family response regulator
MAPSMPSILIVDDHEIVRGGLRSLIADTRPDWKIVGEAETGTDALDAVENLEPDVVILDITLPGMNGLRVGAKIRELGLSARVLFFTMHDYMNLPNDVRGAGGRGYVLKTEAGRNLIHAIEVVHAGGTFFGDSAE